MSRLAASREEIRAFNVAVSETSFAVEDLTRCISDSSFDRAVSISISDAFVSQDPKWYLLT